MLSNEILCSIYCQALREKDGHLEPCGNVVIPPHWKYCGECSSAAIKKAKADRQREKKYVQECRQNHPDKYQTYDFCYRHGLTESHLREKVEHAPSLRDLWPSAKDEQREFALSQLRTIKQPFQHNLDDLPSTAAVAWKQTSELLRLLEAQQGDRPDIVLDRLIVYIKELMRDLGEWYSSRTFPRIAKRVKGVRELWYERGDLLNLVHALFVEVEIRRLRFFTTAPRRMKLLYNARQWLDAACYVCSLYTGEDKLTADFLRFYGILGKIRLAYDEGQPECADDDIELLQELATHIALTYGKQPAVSLLTSIEQAEHDMRLGKFDSSRAHLQDAQDAFSSPMSMQSLSVHESIAYVETGLAFADKSSQQYQQRYEYLEKYVRIFSRYPCSTHRRYLEELKTLYPKDIPDLPIVENARLYIDPMFKHLQPVLLNI